MLGAEQMIMRESITDNTERMAPRRETFPLGCPLKHKMSQIELLMGDMLCYILLYSEILTFLSPRCIPKGIINEGSPELKDEILAEAFSDKVDDILLELSKMSLFEEASEN